ncbi:hypothetical protein PCC7424_2191 [Gloeothece citriformis PCC 7424]|uniref:Uncharacterized protein n=1 Tax=Gloeothece citriformis (strain PCC 7424) TaxID=65393 RepID=B7KGE2_GLOC7|nr:hypothetical protein [Gloeothece citriformis]ACK70613.1 hypothetical protein PCC7424_2191 [Gloeothece citriformis PCC 7424]
MRQITQLPDDETLDKLISLAKEAEQSARDLYDLATAIDEKWRIKLEKRRQKIIDESKQKKTSEV